jgi:hypothetical protein
MVHQTYEEAARDYLAKFSELMQQPLDVNAVTGQGEMPAVFLAQRAEEIAGVSTSMIGLARIYFTSANPAEREGVSGHFVDQASAELLLATEWMQRTGAQETDLPHAAAERATQNAALREAINAAEQATSIPVIQGLPASVSYRTTESATADEAAAELAATVMSAVGGISSRVQELGAEIAFDLVQRKECDEVDRGACLSDRDIAGFCADALNPAGKLILTAHRKIAALSAEDGRAEVRHALPSWLHQIKRSNEIRFSDAVLQKACPHTSIEPGIQQSGAALEIINETSDLIKSISDNFIVLAARMRKLEDAIRLSRRVKLPQWSLTMVALQVTLLAGLICTGRRYLRERVQGTLRDRGFIS